MSEVNHNLSEENLVASVSLQQDISISSDDNREKEIDWHKLAHKLREHNRKLLKKVFQLEQEAIENNQALEEQQKIARSHDLYMASQAKKIDNYHEQVAELLEKISVYEQQEEHQQSTVAILSQQLNILEEKADKLEKDCAKLKVLNEEREEEIAAKKQQIQELNTRYYRQQQYLLEHKASQQEVSSSDRHIKAWSVHSASNAAALTLETTTSHNHTSHNHNSDWPAPAIAKTQDKLKSIAGVKLPKFPRRAEGQ